MRQMHLGARVGQHVGRPVPAVGGLQHDLRVLAGLGDLGRQRHRIVVDARAAQPVAVLGHPHQHRPAPVQIDTHDLPSVVLCLHGGASFTVRL
jgi:hypothetical protein